MSLATWIYTVFVVLVKYLEKYHFWYMTRSHLSTDICTYLLTSQLTQPIKQNDGWQPNGKMGRHCQDKIVDYHINTRDTFCKVDQTLLCPFVYRSNTLWSVSGCPTQRKLECTKGPKTALNPISIFYNRWKGNDLLVNNPYTRRNEVVDCRLTSGLLHTYSNTC